MKIMLMASYADSIVGFRGDLIRELISEGHEIIVCAPNVTVEVRSELQGLGAVVEQTALTRTGLSPCKDVLYVLSICKLIRTHKPNLVLTYTVKPNIWGALAAQVCGVRSISMITGLGFAFIDRNSLKQKLIGRLVQCLYRMSTRANHLVIFQNEDDSRDFIKNRCLSDESKVRYVRGSGVNVNHYSQVALPSKPIFLLIARLLFSKGVIEYAKASALVRIKHPEARFLLAGFLDEGHDCLSSVDLNQVVNMGLEYLGELTDVRDVIASSSIYVLPSYREGTPRSVLEAMAMGRGIVTTDAPGCRETTIDGHNGYLVPVRNVSKLAEKMLVLASDEDKRIKFGDASRKLAENRFSVDKVNAVLIGYITDVVNGK